MSLTILLHNCKVRWELLAFSVSTLCNDVKHSISEIQMVSTLATSVITTWSVHKMQGVQVLGEILKEIENIYSYYAKTYNNTKYKPNPTEDLDDMRSPLTKNINENV